MDTNKVKRDKSFYNSLHKKSETYFQFTDDSGSIIGYKQLLKMIDHHLVLT